jgi:hypothetical protein
VCTGVPATCSYNCCNGACTNWTCPGCTQTATCT